MDEYTEYLRGFYEINCKSFAFSKWPPIRTIQFAELALAEIVSNDVEQQERGESSHLSTLQRPVKKTRATLDQVLVRCAAFNGLYTDCCFHSGSQDG